MPRKAKPEAKPASTPRPPSKLDRLIAILLHEDGADMAAMVEATGWQAHSVRGALAGALKKRGHAVLSEKAGKRRVWRIAAPVEAAQ
ncbi:MAG: DUF3489 domain-containing protein [Brevundimonas sp.]|uniref:DUF3489 domain-containing protein n=1 Tax=Brevundimonas sp. TaxID=1871086 RepID=UPI001A19240C|nr:DUF3489 domain-containing protein [Brevundimonas sp.]MBJ7446261.1 DUF3489 domain-containing protein [Brevundimonas sp.]